MNRFRLIALLLVAAAMVTAVVAAFRPSTGLFSEPSGPAVVVDRSAGMIGTDASELDPLVRALVDAIGANRIHLFSAASDAQQELHFDPTAGVAGQLAAPNEFDPWFLSTDLVGALKDVSQGRTHTESAATPGRILLYSDGRVVDPDRLVTAAADIGVPIDTVLAQPPEGPEVALLSVGAPPAAPRNTPVTATATVFSRRGQSVVLRVVQENVFEYAVRLQPGITTVPLTVGPFRRPYNVVAVEVMPEQDTIVSNNRREVVIRMGTEERVLLVADQQTPPDWATWLGVVVGHRNDAAAGPNSAPGSTLAAGGPNSAPGPEVVAGGPNSASGPEAAGGANSALGSNSRPAAAYPGSEATVANPGSEAGAPRTVEFRPIQDMPATLSDLLGYSTVVLSDVSAVLLSTAHFQALTRYVAAGGGLVVLGGPNSYGPGLYQDSPMADILPVDLDMAGAVEVPDLALVYVLDASGSMGNYVNAGKNKLEIVKEATRASINLLTGYQQVGVVSFDIRPNWVLPIGPTEKASQLPRMFASLHPGGGTRLDRALSIAAKELAATPAAARHIIVLSDGLTDEQEIEPVIQSLIDNSISVTAVGVGQDVDQALLRDLTTRTGGRVYFTSDSRDIPAVFTSETAFVSTGLVRNRRELVFPGRPHEITRSVPLDKMAAVGGLALSFPKPGSSVLIQTSLGNPVLATGTYGAGRVAAYTSSVTGPWAEPLAPWEHFPRLIANTVDWTVQEGATDLVSMEAQLEGQRLTVTAIPRFSDRIAGAGDSISTIKPENGEPRLPGSLTVWVQNVPFAGAGMQRASEALRSLYLQLQPDGTYIGQMGVGTDVNRFIVRLDAITTAGRGIYRAPPQILQRDYPEELRPGPPNADALRRVAQATGGIFVEGLPGTDVQLIADRIVQAMPNERRPVVAGLLILSAVMFVGAIWVWGLGSGTTRTTVVE